MIVVRESRPKTRTYIGIMFAGMCLAGCGPTKKSVLPQPPPVHVDRWGTQAAIARVKNLSREADNLASDSQQLPGHDAADHSRVMQRIFTDLIQTLTLMGTPSDDRVLAQRITIIQTSRAGLASGAADLRVEPTIDTGLRAAVAALADLSHSDAFEQADLGKDLDTLSGLLSRLDLSERDPDLHRVDVAETVDLISKVVSKLAASLSARLTVEQHTTPTTTSEPSIPAPAATQPATPAVPATEPAAPATQPARPAVDSAAPTSPAAAPIQPAPPELNK